MTEVKTLVKQNDKTKVPKVPDVNELDEAVANELEEAVTKALKKKAKKANCIVRCCKEIFREKTPEEKAREAKKKEIEAKKRKEREERDRKNWEEMQKGFAVAGEMWVKGVAETNRYKNCKIG